MKTTIAHKGLGVSAEVNITQETAETFGDIWEDAKTVEGATQKRRFYRTLLACMQEANMVVIHSPQTPLGLWDPNQVEWLAGKANALYTEAVTIPPE